MERKIKFTQGEYYHVYSRGVEKRKIFLDGKDHERFLALLYIMNQNTPFNFANFLKYHKLEEIFSEKREKPLVSILSYALMPNHFHILVYEHTKGGISKFMMRLLTAYSMYFNTKYERSGPLFIHPFRSAHILKEPQYLWIFSYIHLNPLKIKKINIELVTPKNLSLAESFLNSYKYSSYIDYEGSTRPHSKILEMSIVPEYLLKTSVNLKDYKKWLMVENIEGYPRY